MESYLPEDNAPVVLEGECISLDSLGIAGCIAIIDVIMFGVTQQGVISDWFLLLPPGGSGGCVILQCGYLWGGGGNSVWVC